MSRDSSEYLLDTSALVNLVSDLDLESLRKSKVRLYITQLTPFEVGNVLWKLYVRGVVSKDEAKAIMKLVIELVRMNLLRVVTVADFEDVLDLCLGRKLTYYDASYLHTALEKRMTLVTDDSGLRAHARGLRVSVITSDEFKQRHPELFKQ